MYVSPRPSFRDDPNFPLRMALLAVISVGAIPFVMPSMPALMAALPFGLMAGMRKAFDPKKAIGGPLALIMMIWLASGVLTLLMSWPVALSQGSNSAVLGITQSSQIETPAFLSARMLVEPEMNQRFSLVNDS